jgi:hypothetical protein
LKRKYVSISIPEGRNRQGKISINLLAVVEASNWLYRRSLPASILGNVLPFTTSPRSMVGLVEETLPAEAEACAERTGGPDA